MPKFEVLTKIKAPISWKNCLSKTEILAKDGGYSHHLQGVKFIFIIRVPTIPRPICIDNPHKLIEPTP